MTMRSSCLAFMLLAACLARGENAVISIVKQGATRDAIVLSGLNASGAQSRLFAQVLQADLERSGWFTVQPSGAARVSGTVSDSGEGVQVACTVTASVGGFSWSHDGSASTPRHEAHLLADEIVKHLKGVNGFASTRIVMVRRARGGADLFVCDSDGMNMMQVTHDNAFCVAPRWTPDGHNVYYTGYFSGRPCAYRISADTAERRTLSNYLGLNAGATVSPNGRDVAIVLSFPGNPDLFLIQLGSGALTRLTHTPMAAEASPAWSPDGRQLAYVSDATGKAQIYIMDMATRQSRRMTFRGSESLSPSWGKDGRIAYMTRRGGPYVIAVLDPREGESRDTVSLGPDEDPSWAPDCRHIVCSHREAGGSSIYILDTLGDPPVRLFALSGDWVSPDWSER